VLGLLHDSWRRRSQTFLMNLHALIGLLVWALIVIHLLAALWHQFVWRDLLLQRMWPAAAPGRAAARSRIRASRP
jgi:cytochrome b561